MGQSPPSDTYNIEGLGIPFFQGKAEFTDLYPIEVKWCTKPKKIAIANDILLSVRAPVGATNIANQECCIGRGLAAIRYSENYKFIFYFLRSIEKELDKKGTGSTFKAISGDILKNVDVPFPKLEIQNQIVEKIEELLSELDRGAEDLKEIKEKLKIFRQSVLSAAFSGRLTNKNLKNGELPRGWEKIKLGEIIKVRSGNGLTSANMVSNGKYPVYGGNGISGYHNEYMFKESKLIIGRVGAKCGVAHITKPKSWVTDNALICDFDFIEFNLSFIFYLFKNINLNKLSVSTAQPVISGTKIYNVVTNIPEINEQQKIVEEIENRLSVCDKMEETIETALAQSESLRQSILKQAFEGKIIL